MRRLLLLAAPLLFTGCFLGTFQSAETAGAGRMDGALHLGYGTTLHPDHLNSINPESSRVLVSGLFNIGGYFGIGVSNQVDVGVTMYGMGLGPYAKFQLYRSRHDRFMVSLLPKLTYDFLSISGYGSATPSYTIIPAVDLIFGSRVSKWATLYYGYQAVFAPAYFDEDAPFSTYHLPGEIGVLPGYSHAVFFGIDVKSDLRSLGVKSGSSTYPYGIRLEMGLTYASTDLPYPIASIGIAITGMSAIACLGFIAQTQSGGGCVGASSANAYINAKRKALAEGGASWTEEAGLPGE